MASQAEIEDEIYARRLQSEGNSIFVFFDRNPLSCCFLLFSTKTSSPNNAKEMEIARATGQTTDQDSQLARF